MSLQWYPGHMTKARRELAALVPSQDVVIEVLDARLPASSGNPVLTELRRAKPCIKVLTKSDLADPAATRAWLAYFAGDPAVTAIASTTDRPQDTRKRIASLNYLRTFEALREMSQLDELEWMRATADAALDTLGEDPT